MAHMSGRPHGHGSYLTASRGTIRKIITSMMAIFDNWSLSRIIITQRVHIAILHMAHTWALKGFLHPYFGVYLCTMMILGPFG